MLAFALTINIAFAFQANRSDTTVHLAKTKLGGTRSSYPKNGLHLALPPLKPAVTSNAKINLVRTDDKLLTDVQVYPNPVTDQINLRYDLSRNTNVTIKIVDMLGNDVATIFSQRVESGDQKFTYIINNKLSRGFYFLRIIAGTESTIKRLSVL